MTNEPEDKTGGVAQDDDADAEQDRPTVAPPFDPVAFAQEVLGGRPSPPAGTPAVKAAGHVTPPPPARSTPSGVARPPLPTLTDPAELEAARLKSVGTRPFVQRPTPQGLLSLANARIPSNLPPRNPPPRPTESTGAFATSDREWEELATSPPPPMQQDFIDAMARDAPPSTEDAAALANLAARQAASQSAVTTAQEMNDRVSLGDYTGALEVAEKLLELDPDDQPVQICAESCRGILKQMYTARIGPLERVPVVMVARDQLRWLSIDHRAGFVLSLVDGVSSLEMILDVSGMAELDALRILSELAQQRIISFR